jgi:N-acetylglucosamine malate deacetylase 1
MDNEKLDVLAFGAHPDDVELSCSGTLMKMLAAGKKVGVVDLTRGELGTRGTPETRAAESAAATQIMGLTMRDNLGLSDGFLENDSAHRKEVIRAIRRYKPDLVIANAPRDRHPDHGKASDLVRDAAFLSGLSKAETFFNDRPQAAWRPKRVIFYIQDLWLRPSFVVDITPFWERKMKSIEAYTTQFFTAESKEPETYISTVTFKEFLEARSREMGHFIGAKFGEGFITRIPLRVEDPTEL